MDNKEVNNDSTAHRESFTELIGRLANDSAAVFHDEIELVSQGIREKMVAARSGALTIVTGAVVGLIGLMSLCAALIIELTSYMAPGVAALSVGAALACIGVGLVFTGYNKLKQQPKHT